MCYGSTVNTNPIWCEQYSQEDKTMTVSENRKIGQRCDNKIPIVVSPFNSKDMRDALLIDHSEKGITFISKDVFPLRTAVVIRVENGSQKGSGNCDFLSLPNIRIGSSFPHVDSWCREEIGSSRCRHTPLSGFGP